MSGGGGGGSGGINVDPTSNPNSFFGQILNPLTGAQQTQNAINAQTSSVAAANQTQANIFNTETGIESPYLQAGSNGLSQLQLALPGLTKPFSMSDFQNNPGYQFQMQQGLQALNQSAAAKGELGSGGTMKAIEQYGQGLAGTQYQQAFNNYMAQNQQSYGMLSGLANYGQVGAGQLTGAAQNYGNQVSGNQVGLGNSIAAANIGQANRTSGLIGQGATAGAIAFSDRRLKTDIERISKEDLDELKATLKAYRFKYKSEKHGQGDWIGVMAQDLEKSKIGKGLVVTNKEGFKTLDMLKVMSLFLATLAEV